MILGKIPFNYTIDGIILYLFVTYIFFLSHLTFFDLILILHVI